MCGKVRFNLFLLLLCVFFLNKFAMHKKRFNSYYCFWILFEQEHDRTNKMTCAPSGDSYQPWHQPSLIRAFAVHMNKLLVLSFLLRAWRRLWSVCVDAQAGLSLRWAHVVLLVLSCRGWIYEFKLYPRPLEIASNLSTGVSDHIKLKPNGCTASEAYKRLGHIPRATCLRGLYISVNSVC